MINPEFETMLMDSFVKSFGSTLSECDANCHYEVREIRDNKGISCDNAVVLTISSHLFRIIYFFYFNNDQQSDQFVANGLNIKNDSVSQARINDYLCEVSNSLFGSVKRIIGQSVTSLGMSTPNILDSSSFKYIDELKIDSSGYAVAEQNGEPLFYASFHVSASAELNFNIEQQLEEEVDSGELEFF